MLSLNDILRLAIKGLSERRLRASLTIVGIAIGPLALVMMTSVVEGYSDYVTKQIESLGQNLIVVFPRENFELTEKDLDFIRSIPGVEEAEPFYLVHATVRVGNEEKEVTVYATSIPLIFKAIANLEVEQGEVPSSSNIIAAIVGHDIAYDENGNQVYHVGDAITITMYMPKHGGGFKVKHITVLIAGILKRFGGAFFLSPDTSIYLWEDAGPKILGLHKWSGILVLVKRSDLVPKVFDEIKNAYQNNVDLISFQGIARVVSSITAAMNFITFSTSLSAFAVAVAGVAATMITSVMERVREIGVMKALGFTDAQVLAIVLCEAILMSLIGGAIGITLGVIGAYIMSSKGFVIHGIATKIVISAPPKITVELIARTIAITLIVGIAGGIFPAYRAAKIPPAIALRYE